MRGDFSSFWKKEAKRNFNGVLHQQGRVLLDRDWNAQTEIVNDWQEAAAADIIGAGVAAVPADAAESFKVTKAEIVNDLPDRIEIVVNGGHVWADGLLIESRGARTREATYFEPPVQNQKASIPDNFPINPPDNPAIRDAVILEAWHEELNAFQLSDLLIEPALGGIDTTERLQTAYRYRLFRIDEDDTCDSIIERLKNNFDNRGSLTVTLQETQPALDADCPVPKGGGYTGFEHQLYRIEIAQTKHAKTYFKWSQFNGGLVGKGRFVGNGANRKVKIDANQNAILNSDLTSFYLETLQRKNGYWQVTFGAKVTLDTSDNSLKLPADAADDFFGSPPTPDTKPIFFRLWNDIRLVGDFTGAADLQDGIKLQFQPEADADYTAHDYWTFTVRAGEIPNDNPLIDNRPPQGIFYHRVPVAELNWTRAGIDSESGDIEDCRRIFQPLTRLRGCCTYRVGDGVNSHGDFTSIRTAIEHLPKDGGQICVLPGEYAENLTLDSAHNRNISIKGCGDRSRIVGADDVTDPIIHVKGGMNLKIESLAILANRKGVTGILLDGDEIVANPVAGRENFGRLQNVKLENLRIFAAKESAIEMHVGQFVSIRGCQIFVEDVETEWQSAVYLAGDDLLFEENEIRVTPEREQKSGSGKTHDPQPFVPAQKATGGLHIAGGSERVRIINNLIAGGTGNGITLGSIDVETNQRIEKYRRWQPKSGRKTDKCDHLPGVLVGTLIDGETRFKVGDQLTDVLIERNRIFSMGLNGIGVDGFFPMETDPNEPNRKDKRKIQSIAVENLTIIGNRIEFCLNNLTTELPPELAKFAAFGGIALGAVDNLIVRDNIISDNGATFLEPACGIFVLLGRGLEISRNHIMNNGRAATEKDNLKSGARSGVFIQYVVNGMSQFAFFEPKLAPVNRFLRLPGSVPALKMHENIVAAPVGRALTVFAAGNIDITDNQFLSQSLVPQFDIQNFAAATVLIVGFNTSDNYQTQPQSFTAYRWGQVSTKMRTANSVGKYTSPKETVGVRADTVGILANNPEVNILPFSGTIHFAGNQCRLTGTVVDRTLAAFSSVLILSLSDIGFLGNQTDSRMVKNFLLTDTYIFGANVRANDNSWQQPRKGVVFSAITLGGNLNTTTDNQSSFCLFILGRLFLARHNLTLFDLAAGLKGDITTKGGTRCQGLVTRLLTDFGEKPRLNTTVAGTNPSVKQQ